MTYTLNQNTPNTTNLTHMQCSTHECTHTSTHQKSIFVAVRALHTKLNSLVTASAEASDGRKKRQTSPWRNSAIKYQHV